MSDPKKTIDAMVAELRNLADRIEYAANNLEISKQYATGSAAVIVMRAALIEILVRTNREKARDYDAALKGGILEIHDIANTALNESKGE